MVAPPRAITEYVIDEMNFSNVAISCGKRHQMTLPLLGTIHGCNDAFSPFMFASNNAVYSKLKDKTLNCKISDSLPTQQMCSMLDRLTFEEIRGRDLTIYANSYNSTMETILAFIKSDHFKQLVEFISKFKVLLNNSFCTTDKHHKTSGHLELFQKMILMHATYFVATIFMCEQAEKTDVFLKYAFNNIYFSKNILTHFKQRTTVFLVPRRHGKTWFLVPLITLLLGSFKGIKIGYTSHIRKATEPVFDEIERKLRSIYGVGSVDHVKGETIAFTFPDKSKSTIVFASSHNTNVSILL